MSQSQNMKEDIGTIPSSNGMPSKSDELYGGLMLESVPGLA